MLRIGYRSSPRVVFTRAGGVRKSAVLIGVYFFSQANIRLAGRLLFVLQQLREAGLQSLLFLLRLIDLLRCRADLSPRN